LIEKEPKMIVKYTAAPKIASSKFGAEKPKKMFSSF
jgi:hypothetical protein